VKYLRQLLKQFTDKTSTVRDALNGDGSHAVMAHALGLAQGHAQGGADEGGGYHGHMLTAVDDTEGEGISEKEMEAAMVKATAIAKDSRIATLERENEMLRQQVELAQQQQSQSPSLGKAKVFHCCMCVAHLSKL
jgi:hypothetical protein